MVRDDSPGVLNAYNCGLVILEGDAGEWLKKGITCVAAYGFFENFD